MENSRSVQQSSNFEAANRPPSQSESPPDESGSMREQNAEQLDAQGVLNAAAQWAASITGAHGAAVAIGDASKMYCCASFGNAPAVGAPVSSNSGLSGICLGTSEFVRCDDTETDSRVDAVACRKLNLRSVLIVPVLVDSKIRALIEVFSSKPHAFDERQRQDLTRMADSLATLLAERDSQRSARVGSSSAQEPVPATQVEGSEKLTDTLQVTVPPSSASPRPTPIPKISPGGVLAVELHSQPASTQIRSSGKPIVASPDTAESSPFAWPSFSPKGKVGLLTVLLVCLLVVATWYVILRDRTTTERNAGKSITQETAQQPPAEPEITFDQSALSVIAPLGERAAQGEGQTSQLTPGKLLHRVEPDYPPAARNSGIGGSVVLTAIVSRTGAVEDVKFVRGPEALADAAIEAVRQWVYEPYRRNGEAVAVQTTIIVKFTPPRQ
jgi:L-methionine (R)-S-oxide reductase